MAFFDGSGPGGRVGWTSEEQKDGTFLIDGEPFEPILTGTIQRGDWGKNGYGLHVPFLGDATGKEVLVGECVLRPATGRHTIDITCPDCGGPKEWQDHDGRFCKPCRDSRQREGGGK
jgi:hypothetical protein